MAQSELGETLVQRDGAAARRLGQLGIEPGRLFAALDAGDVAARQADGFSPVMAAGTLRWLETVRMLRQGLVTDGWEINDERNSPRVFDPTGRFAVLPVSGSADTGLADGTPTTANPRGAASSRAVQINQQLQFDFSVALLADIADIAGEKAARVTTWFLLYFRAQNDELRAELSLPSQISDRGVVRGWRERILLPPRTFGPEQAIPRDAGDDDGVEFYIAAR